MAFARRLVAATMVFVLAVFPVALERCRTGCVTPPVVETASAAPGAHACHDASSGDDGGARMEPMARACGHSDETRTYEPASLAAGKTQSVLVLSAQAPPPHHVHANAGSSRIDWSSGSGLPLLRPLNSPLRL